MERLVERVLFAARWFVVPIYLGLVVVLVILSFKFFEELLHLALTVRAIDGTELILLILSLIDLALVASLIVMVIIGSYESIVGRIDVPEGVQKPDLFDKLDPSTLKLKLQVAIIAISSIHLLKAFMNIADKPTEKVLMQLAIHGMFVVSALGLAMLDRIGKKG
ncbi:MAG: TIGR00645 family protein [Alphaproteobacteria bacterium]|nr:TIGR00645 family protein [Alphaproteobacteria bacterium]